MKDILKELEAIHRETGKRRIPAGDARTVCLRRSYDAAIDDVWDAITNRERIVRWFLPVTGDLRLGGTYQLEGNAGGRILRCEPPRVLALSWVFGKSLDQDDESSLVEVRLSSRGAEKTELELEHTAVVPPEMWAQFGPGAVGVGWDGGLLGLSLHLAGRSMEPAERDAWNKSAEAKQFMTESSRAWGVAYAASGASATEVADAVTNTTGFYVPS